MSEPANLKIALFGGAGIGLLFGVIMGTTTTPTVATMLGTLTTLLAAILGLNDDYFNNAKAMRIGGFGVACVLGAYLGIFVRTHSLLAPSPADMKQKYLEAGFTEEQALNFVAMQEFGATLDQLEGQTMTVAQVAANGEVSEEEDGGTGEPAQTVVVQSGPSTVASEVFKGSKGYLFSSPVEISNCEELVFTDEDLPLEEIFFSLETMSNDWVAHGERLKQNVPEALQKNVFLITKEVTCGFEEEVIEECEAASAVLGKHSDFFDLVDEMASIHEHWDGLSLEVATADMEDEGLFLAMTEVHTMLCKNSESK